jgi:hypothetical protein
VKDRQPADPDEAAAAAWNRRYGVGTVVDVQQGPQGARIRTKTRNPAWVLSGGPHVAVHGLPGAIPLEYVTPVVDEDPRDVALAQARARFARVRALHARTRWPADDGRAHPGEQPYDICACCQRVWPCETIEALDAPVVDPQ